MSYVYINTESFVEDGVRHNLYTVGFYKPDGSFEPDEDFDNKGEARDRVAVLNGGWPEWMRERFNTACAALEYMEGRG